MARTTILNRGSLSAYEERSELVIEGRGPGGEIVRTRLPADLDFLWQWVEFLNDAGEALALQRSSRQALAATTRRHGRG